MREIKFRAWYEKEKLLGIVEFLDFEFQKVTLIRHDSVNSFYRYNIDLDKVKLMQYTGLKDCKGKEIYEGDILQRIDGGVIKEVRFNAFHAMFETVILKSVEEYWIGSASMLSKYICDNYHVIGNIFENLEGLK